MILPTRRLRLRILLLTKSLLGRIPTPLWAKQCRTRASLVSYKGIQYSNGIALDANFRYYIDICHSSQATKSRVAQFVWGPIGPPNKQVADKDPWGKEFGSKVYDGEAVSSLSSEGRRV